MPNKNHSNAAKPERPPKAVDQDHDYRHSRFGNKFKEWYKRGD